jgi:Skp family chaperone for outer membrane proteins
MSSSRPVTGSAATPQTSASRPAGAATSSAPRTVSTTVAAPSSSSSRPAGVSDYRSNIDRQSREQKSIGGILNLIVYGLIAFFVLAALLAAYGANDVYKQLHQQSVTVTDLDSRYSAANQQLDDQIKREYQARKDLEAQLNRTQELAVREQDSITKLQAALDAQTDALRQERATRAAETSIRVSENSALRARVRALEEKNEQTYRP